MRDFSDTELRHIATAMNYIASKCASPYYTRIVKGCYVADMLSYEAGEEQVTGLGYVHAPNGPLIDDHEELRETLEKNSYINLFDDGHGLLYQPFDNECHDFGVFDDDTIAVLDDTAAFVDSYDTVKQLCDATHSLTAWKTTRNGDALPLMRNAEVTALVENTIYEPTDELIAAMNETVLYTADSLEELLETA